MWVASERLSEKVTPRSLIVLICLMPVIGSGKVGLALFPGRQMIISLVLERLISSLFVADQSFHSKMKHRINVTKSFKEQKKNID